MSSVGAGGPRSTGNSGTFFLTLKPREERQKSADEVMQDLRRKLSGLPGLNVFLQNPPSIRIGGRLSKSQYQYTLQDLDQEQLYRSAGRLVEALSREPGFQGVTSDMDVTSPSREPPALSFRIASTAPGYATTMRSWLDRFHSR